jgi:type VI secretion system protein ImpK
MRLTDCFIDLIAYVAYFTRRVDVNQPPFEQIQADVLRLLSDSQTSMSRGSLPPEDYDLARFAIIAWVDDTIMNSQWSHRDRWKRELLQRDYYQTTDAGEIFFKRLNQVGLHQRDAREIYYLCLAMGFKGQYCHDGDEFLLDQLKISNLKLLTGSSLGVPRLEKGDLFPEAYSAEAEMSSTTKRRWWHLSPFTWLGLGFPVVLFIGLFVIYSFILNHLVDNLLSKLP